MELPQLREAIAEAAGPLWTLTCDQSKEWLSPVFQRLDLTFDDPEENQQTPKTFADPVLGPIKLYDWEVTLLDCPALQRLRGIRQLGMVHCVYPGATHDRLSHSIGVVEIIQRMIDAISRNITERFDVSTTQDHGVQPPTEEDRWSCRLAALLHDVGHGPFSHASEPFIEHCWSNEVNQTKHLFWEVFEGCGNLKPSEILAGLFVLSPEFQRVIEHTRYKIPINTSRLPLTITARLFGSRSHLNPKRSYLSTLVSGSVDADKLDYMVRDAFNTGLPVGLDVRRLIDKLEVVIISSDNINEPSLQKRAQNSPGGLIYELGLSFAGLTALEQMIIGRVLLYDRVYYHHKVRCAEAMVRKLMFAIDTQGELKGDVQHLLMKFSDDTFLQVMAGNLSVPGISLDIEDSTKKLAANIANRDYHKRAFVFAERFLRQAKASDQEQSFSVWDSIYERIQSDHELVQLGQEIRGKAEKLSKAIPDLGENLSFDEHSVIVDFRGERVISPGHGLMLRSYEGHPAIPNLFFDPEKWAKAYRTQKRCGFVFCPKQFRLAVFLASTIVFYENFGAVMRKEALYDCKMHHLVKNRIHNWLEKALKSELCSLEAYEILSTSKIRYFPLKESQFLLPQEWIQEDPNCQRSLAEGLQRAIPSGLSPKVGEYTVQAIEHVSFVLDSLVKSGTYTNISELKETGNESLQKKLVELLRARGCDVFEGSEFGGGETDILFPGDIVMELKVIRKPTEPNTLPKKADWQARRYARPLCRKIAFTFFAYKPKGENSILPLPSSIEIKAPENSLEDRAAVHFYLPWGESVPSRAKPPKI